MGLSWLSQPDSIKYLEKHILESAQAPRSLPALPGGCTKNLPPLPHFQELFGVSNIWVQEVCVLLGVFNPLSHEFRVPLGFQVPFSRLFLSLEMLMRNPGGTPVSFSRFFVPPNPFSQEFHNSRAILKVPNPFSQVFCVLWGVPNPLFPGILCPQSPFSRNSMTLGASTFLFMSPNSCHWEFFLLWDVPDPFFFFGISSRLKKNSYIPYHTTPRSSFLLPPLFFLLSKNLLLPKV